MRHRNYFFGLVFLSSICGPFVCAQDVYRIDPNQSTIGFSVKHMLINTVHGKFTDYSGTILLNENDLTKSSANLKINTASINTEVAPRDKDLRSPNFLDVAKYPEIIFTSHRVEKNANGYVLVGELAMRGVSKEVTIPFKYNGKVKDLLGNTRIGFEGGLTINRQEWGISYSRVLDSGGLVAGNEVKIELDIEAVKK
jgi:polyisoprenoid-binding protein YceI